MQEIPTPIPSDATRSPDPVDVLVSNHRRFLTFLEARTGDRTLAEDLLQEAFVRSLNRVASLRDEGSVVAWFYRCLRNAVIDHHRRHGAAMRAVDALAREVELEAPREDFEREICRCIADLAGTLKPEYAQAIRDVDVDGMTVKEHAARAGITASNAGVRMFRAREALRLSVAASCGTCAEHGCRDCHCATAPHKPSP